MGDSGISGDVMRVFCFFGEVLLVFWGFFVIVEMWLDSGFNFGLVIILIGGFYRLFVDIGFWDGDKLLELGGLLWWCDRVILFVYEKNMKYLVILIFFKL